MGESTNPLSLSSLNGAHIIVHNKSEKPMFFDGIHVNVGMLTTIGVKREFTSRLSHPFSECVVDVSVYKDKSVYVSTLLDENMTYTQRDCQVVCLQKYVVKYCYCYTLEYPYW